MNTEQANRCPKCQASVEPDSPQGLCPKCLLAAVSAPTEAGQSSEAQPVPALETVAAAFPQLEILEFIGQGGMGLVYKARQPKLDRLVALKLLPQKAGADPTFGERFNREARVLAKLSHPNIVAVHDFGQAGTFFYLLMEFVDGVNLRQAMRAGRFTPEQALGLVPKICDALQYAHEEGVLHRDIKPENLLLDTRGRVKIADFGIAKLQGDSKDITLTAKGASMGTPHYMAPEQLEHPHDVDQRADIYSLGVVFYEMLTGELPLGRFAPPSEKSTVDARVDEIVMRALERERELRFQSAGEVKTRVEYITAHPAPAGNIPNANHDPASGAQPSTPSAPTPASLTPLLDHRQWSKKAIAAAVLVGLSLVEMGSSSMSFSRVYIWGMPNQLSLVEMGSSSMSHGNPGFAELLLLCLFIAGPGLAGLWLARTAMVEIRSAPDRLRGGRLALISIVAWPLLLADRVLYAGLVLVTSGLYRFFGPVPYMLGGMGILALNVFILWYLITQLPREKALAADLVVMKGLKRTPRKVVCGGTLVLLLALLISFCLPRVSPSSRIKSTSPDPMVDEPNPPPGYSVGQAIPLPPGYSTSEGTPLPPGYSLHQDTSLQDGGRIFQSLFSVPAGYLLTVTATISSNQVVLDRGETGSAAFVLAPGGQQIEGNLTWRLLGNTTLADGAPLQFSLGLIQDDGRLRRTFNLTPPVPLIIDWMSEPSRIWPPQNGHTKFLLMKGSEINPSRGDPSPVEWAVGIETRLDPIPDSDLHGLNRSSAQVMAGQGSNWLLSVEKQSQKSASTETNEPALEPPSKTQ